MEKEIMKDNKLIAEFMGMKYGDPNDNSVMTQMTPQGNEVVPINSMKYHSSWDWLMLVIEETDHTSYEPIESIEDALATRCLKDTYKAVAEYVKEYHNKYHKTVHYSENRTTNK